MSAVDLARLARLARLVKPLEWHKSHMRSWNDDWHTVPTGYTVRCADEWGWKWSSPLGAFGYGSSPGAAQAAANADHAARVISALDADLLAELVGALKGLSQAIGSSDDDFQAYTIAMDNGYTRARLTLAKLEAKP